MTLGVTPDKSNPFYLYYVSLLPKNHVSDIEFVPVPPHAGKLVVRSNKVSSSEDQQALEDIRMFLKTNGFENITQGENEDTVKTYNQNVVTIGLLSSKMQQIIEELKIFDPKSDINRYFKFRRVYKPTLFKEEHEELNDIDYTFGDKKNSYDYGLIVKHHYGQYRNKVCICIGGISWDGTHGAAYYFTTEPLFRNISFFRRLKYLKSYRLLSKETSITLVRVIPGQYESAVPVAIFCVKRYQNEPRLIELYRSLDITKTQLNDGNDLESSSSPINFDTNGKGLDSRGNFTVGYKGMVATWRDGCLAVPMAPSACTHPEQETFSEYVQVKQGVNAMPMPAESACCSIVNKKMTASVLSCPGNISKFTNNQVIHTAPLSKGIIANSVSQCYVETKCCSENADATVKESSLTTACFLSIVIPVYNGAGTVIRTLSSIWEQNMHSTEYEVLCVDDCSSDKTREVIEREMKSHSNLHLIRNDRNRRAGGARNHGVEQTKGKYVPFIDADDYFHPESLKQAIGHLKDNPDLDILVCNFSRELPGHPNNDFVHKYSTDDKLLVNGYIAKAHVPCGPCQWLFRREIMTRNNVWFRENCISEDVDWTHRLVLYAKYIQYQPILLTHYTIGTETQTARSYANSSNVYAYMKAGSELYKLRGQYASIGCEKYLHAMARLYFLQGLKYYFGMKDDAEKKARQIRELIPESFNLGFVGGFARRFPSFYSYISNCLVPITLFYLRLKKQVAFRGIKN